MEQEYYHRTGGVNTDGTATYATAADTASEERIKRIIEREFKCSARKFGALCPIDWYIIRDNRIVAVMEVKTRSHESGRYPTVFLNVRKWLALMLASIGTNVPAIYVVAFADGAVCWINVAKVDARRMRLGGCAHAVKSRSDVEPVIEIPVENMIRVPEEARHAGSNTDP